MKRPGLKDVAELAGVSIATVSYVINNTPSQSLSAETIKRVNDAIRELGYIPNLAARTLVNNKSNLLGVLIPQTESGKELMFSNPFYGDFMSAAEYTARKSGYHIMISGAESGRTYAEVARTRGLDGVIVVGMNDDEECRQLKNLNIPVVLVDSYCEASGFHRVSVDDLQGGYMATKYLLEKGIRKIAHVTGHVNDSGVNFLRYKGYEKALQEYGMSAAKSLLLSGEVSFEYGCEMGEYLAGLDERPEGVFVCADILALGLCIGLREKGVSVPKDISVIGFDDSLLSKACDPPLTTIHQDVAAKGAEAVKLLINENHTLQNRVFPLTLVERGSVR
ncbi:LacI family transcriptional regulator [Lacrimispora xylanisolvens]|jgi:LacI family transcriptional regulator|uniref:LacI family transcriptional regulator n=1 Tax=Lacrimispora xylanisolvens TaxID=384636 RepID=A0A2S6HW45_9FIRM|nr:LacI family DNA-binding transcriptional regulator [Hungatella xylanolytica]MBE5990359.1 LacI family transcriptional regulator [Paenibacillaceae bacterium]PPK82168.1 LacI family transcriptional regulator [Hungatella xylanolytica]